MDLNDFPDRRRQTLHGALALFLALVVTVLQVSRLDPVVPVADAHGYASIAYDLAVSGTFTDGSELVPWPQPDPPPGMYVALLYPAFVAAVMKADPGMLQPFACMLEHRKKAREAGCRIDFGLLVPAQTAVAALSAFLVFVAGLAVCRSLACGWLAMLLALATGEYAYYAVQVLTENLVLPLFTVFSIAAVIAWRRQTALPWLLAGLFAGAATLVRPQFAYLFYATLVFAAISTLVQGRGRPGKSALAMAMLAAGYGLVVTPWVVRNALLLGEPGITAGYSGHELSFRLAYNAMSWGEWLVAFIYWLPDFGDSLAAALFDGHLYQRLSFDHPDSYYRLAKAFFRSSLTAAGGDSEHVSYLIREHLLAEPFKHVMVTFALLWRGLWVAKYWGLVAFVMFVPVFIIALRRRWAEMIVLSLPPWFMAGFHAFVSVNVVRYNLIIIPCFAVASAWLLTHVASRVVGRIRTAGRS